MRGGLPCPQAHDAEPIFINSRDEDLFGCVGSVGSHRGLFRQFDILSHLRLGISGLFRDLGLGIRIRGCN